MSSDRRSFLKSIVRGIAGLTLGGGMAWLTLGRGEPCWTDGACRRCPQLDECEQPEGRLTRQQRLPRPPAGKGVR